MRHVSAKKKENVGNLSGGFFGVGEGRYSGEVFLDLYPLVIVVVSEVTDCGDCSRRAGQVGYVSCNMRSIADALIGDTFHLKGESVEPFPGFKPARPMVFAGIYPVDSAQQNSLRSAIEKLALTDSAVTVNIENRYCYSSSIID